MESTWHEVTLQLSGQSLVGASVDDAVASVRFDLSGIW
jgi:hypothetical protein